MSAEPHELSRRAFLAGVGGCAGGLALGGAGAAAVESLAPAGESELTWLPAWRLRELVASRQVSPVEVVEHFLARIEALDGRLGAFVAVAAAEARDAARAAEAALLRGEPLGPLHGVPISVKQLVRARGLPLASGEVATRDSVAAERIRRAGGILLGNTTLAGPSAMLGEASVGAANPWDLARVAGASSSGAAASVAAGLGPVAIGSDGGGSTRLPAAWCGVVGLHPTVGRVPGTHEVWTSLARTGWSGSFGPICRDARDAALVLSVIAGPDWSDLLSFNGPPPDYLADLDGGVRGLRMAWTRDFGSAGRYFTEDSAAVVGAAHRAAERFAALGAAVEEPAFAVADWYPIFTRLAVELSLGGWYPLYAGTTGALARLRGREAGPAAAGDLEDALAARREMAGGFLALLEDYDVLLSATSPRLAPPRDAYASWLEDERYAPEYTCLTGHLNLLGFPALSLPCGFVDGMPVGLQIVAKPDEDAKLLRVAHAFLRAHPLRERPPGVAVLREDPSVSGGVR